MLIQSEINMKEKIGEKLNIIVKDVWDRDVKSISDAVIEIKALFNQDWINVEDRLPDIDEYVIWCRDDDVMFIEHLDKDMDVKKWISLLHITHWMPIPEPPSIFSVAKRQLL